MGCALLRGMTRKPIRKKRITSQGKTVTIHKNSLLGWHLLSESKTLGYYHDSKKVVVGKKVEMQARPGWPNDMPSVCKQGMHASHQIQQTMKSAGPIMCRVLVEGDITNLEYGSDYTGGTYKLATHRNKFAGRFRTVLWMKKIPKRLWELYWTLDDRADPGVAKKLKDWARANGCPFVDHDSYGKLK